MTGCEPTRLALGALVVGTLDADEAAALGAHLRGCAPCRAEHAELAALPEMLDRLDADEAAAAADPPPPALLTRVLAVTARERAARRRRRVLAAVAAAVVLLGGGAYAGVALTAAPAARVVAASDPSTGVQARIRMVAEPGGTRLQLSLSGVAPGERCRLVAVGVDGRREVAATWVATYVGRADVVGTTGIPASRLRGFEVSTLDGRRLVWVPTS